MEAVRERGRQEEVIAQAEALRQKCRSLEKPDDMEKAARELHDLQERWKTAAEAPKAQAQTLWHRYRQAADPIQAKARDFFAARAQERDENLKKKIALIERAEAIADSNDWIKTADELKKLQAEWRSLRSRAAPRHQAPCGSGSATRATASSRAATRILRSARKCGR